MCVAYHNVGPRDEGPFVFECDDALCWRLASDTTDRLKMAFLCSNLSGCCRCRCGRWISREAFPSIRSIALSSIWFCATKTCRSGRNAKTNPLMGLRWNICFMERRAGYFPSLCEWETRTELFKQCSISTFVHQKKISQIIKSQIHNANSTNPLLAKCQWNGKVEKMF